MGYGYGIWLRVKNPFINQITKHIPHVTVICNMEKNEAIKLYQNIESKFGLTQQIYTNGICKYFEDKYDKKDILKACGYDCQIKNWQYIYNECLKYQGVLPKQPHLTIQYEMKKKT